MTNLERIRKELSPARRKKVEARAAQLIAEEMTLQELRRARKLTQVRRCTANRCRCSSFVEEGSSLRKTRTTNG